MLRMELKHVLGLTQNDLDWLVAGGDSLVFSKVVRRLLYHIEKTSVGRYNEDAAKRFTEACR